MKGYRVYDARSLPPRTYGVGRVCEHEGCAVLLSRYNPLPFCTIHEKDWYTPESLDIVYNGEGERFCSACQRFRPPYITVWFADKHSPDGLGTMCKACIAGNQRVTKVPEGERKRRELKAHRARQLRYYYKKKHGMTREEWRARKV